MDDIGVEDLSIILKSTLDTKETITYKTLQQITNAPSSFVSNDAGILSVAPTYHDHQLWIANGFLEPLNIAQFQPIVPVLPMVPEGYTMSTNVPTPKIEIIV